MERAILIKPDGAFQIVPIVGRTLDWIGEMIGAEQFRVMPSDLLCPDQVLIFSAEDDKQDDNLNLLASRLNQDPWIGDGPDRFVYGYALVMDCRSVFAVLGSEDECSAGKE